MGQMTLVRDPDIDQRLSTIIGDLTRELVSAFHPSSIILSGSFATGEAAVFRKDGSLLFLSDCEVSILPNWHIFNRKRLGQFSESFRQRTGLKVEISGVKLSCYLVVPFLNRWMRPTIDNYTIKHGARTIYGRDYLKRMPEFRAEDISLWEGVRMLLNRMAEALVHFAPEKPTPEMVFWTDKIILACQDALLLSFGKYHHRYGERTRMIEALFSAHAGELGDVPDFVAMAAEATMRKGGRLSEVENPAAYWFETMRVCDKVFRYAIRKHPGFEFGDYLDFQTRYARHHGRDIPLQTRLALKKFLVSRQLASSLAVILLPRPRDQIIYSAVPLLYFGTSADGAPNQSYLDRVMSVLRSIGTPEDVLVAHETIRRRLFYEIIG